MKSKQEFSNESDLIEGIRQGKREALQELYDLQYRSLWLYASRILGDRDQAEDVVAESFFKIWQRREDFGNLKKLLSYLYVITRNACFDLVAQNKRRHISHNQIAYLADKQEEVIHNTLVRAELLQLILLESETLPPRLRDVFRLIYLEGLTLPETAERLGVSFNTVRTQKKTAIKKMKEAFQKKGISGLATGWIGI